MGLDDTPNNQRVIDAEALIEAFGGIRPMAHRLDIAVSTVQGWKARNHIPPSRLDEILQAAVSEGIDIDSLAPRDDTSGDTIVLDDKSGESSKTTMKKDESDKKATPPPTLPENETGNEAPLKTGGGSSVAWLALALTIVMGGAILARPVWAPIVYPKIAPYMEKYIPMGQHHTAMGMNGHNINMAEEHTATLARISVLEEALAQLSIEKDSAPLSQNNTTDSAMNALDSRLISLEDGGAALEMKISEALKLIQNTAVVEKSVDGEAIEISTFTNQLALLSDAQLALQEKLATVSNADTNTLTDMTTAMDSLAQLTSTLEAKIAELDAKITNAANNPISVPGQQASALVVSISQLESQVLSGKTYAMALNTVEALAKNYTALAGDVENLGIYAQSGIVSKIEISRRFAALAPNAQTAYRKANAQDWIDETLENIKGLVSIRRIGDDPDLPPVSRAEAALGRDDLNAAIKALSEISDSDTVSNWINDAKAHLLVEAALYNLRTQAVNLLVEASAGAGK